MADEFTNNIPEKFPNTSNKDPVERPWDVPEPGLGSSLKKDDMTERIHHLYAELRSSLTVRSALEYDLKKANRLLEEVNRIRGEVEKIIEMLRVMEEYMKERIK
jgi:hypothetical protein